ncbi:SinR family protein [Chromobacterium haemolyticum]|uniref:SinR family protein n=1 Tax=Chromobacterium haemolyticum TaxID=394935 RepID=UPI0011B2636A|nr:SinR family protein [Chromobacterium haemolyticum]
MNKLFIAYDLIAPESNNEEVIYVIKNLGTWAHIQESVWFVSSELNYIEARDSVKMVMHPSDRIFVAEITNAAWSTLGDDVSELILKQWSDF